MAQADAIDARQGQRSNTPDDLSDPHTASDAAIAAALAQHEADEFLENRARLEAWAAAGPHPSLPGVSFSRLTPSVLAPPRRRARSRADERALLLARLDTYALEERVVRGDGCCMYRALADQLYGSEAAHGLVREAVARRLWNHPDAYRAFVPGDYWAYCAAAARRGTWGDHVALQAAADAYGARVALVTTFEQPFIELVPCGGAASPDDATARTVWLSFHAEVHYNSIWPRASTPRAARACPPPTGLWRHNCTIL